VNAEDSPGEGEWVLCGNDCGNHCMLPIRHVAANG
jgi:hypothetical protein